MRVASARRTRLLKDLIAAGLLNDYDVELTPDANGCTVEMTTSQRLAMRQGRFQAGS